jgi:8-oxo-dGTP pyrophosphatase MutT (NUDIX family)
VAHRSSIPLSFYKEYWEELRLRRFSLEVQHRLRTFLELVGFDPDDSGLLAVCESRRVWFRRVYVYPLVEDYFVYWRVIREKPPHFLSLKPFPPQEVQILAIEQNEPE